MTLYLDTSALVKLYCRESDSGQVTGYVKAAGVVACSRIGYVELYSAIGRKMREGALTPKELEQLRGDVDGDWVNYLVLDVSAAVIARAAVMTIHSSVRAYDAIHVASAVILMEKSGTDVEFVSFDMPQRKAAAKEGLTLS